MVYVGKYTQALKGSQLAVGYAMERSIKFQRPADYYAEMVKSDEHMEKVKEKLLHQKREKEEAEERRRIKEQKKYGKAVQNEILKQRAMKRF